jgi:hypothetical protein
MPLPLPPPETTTATTTATTLATATAIKVKGDVWVTGKLQAAAGEDGWWRQISLSFSADFFNGRFLLAYFLFLWVGV